MNNGDNREPPYELLRWCDISAWQPNITFFVMKKWRDAGLIKPVRVTENGMRYYRKSDIKRLIA
jgi:predicted site-specific integrase-resolvase